MNAAGRRVAEEKPDGPGEGAEERLRGEEGVDAASGLGTGDIDTAPPLLPLDCSRCGCRCGCARSAPPAFTLFLLVLFRDGLWQELRPQVPVVVLM